MRSYGQLSRQQFPQRWPLSNPNRTKSIMNNRDNIITTALERSVMNYWGRGLKLVLSRQPHPP